MSAVQIATVEEKGKRSHFRTRIGMDFDSKTTKLHNQEDVDDYLAKYGVCLNPGIKVELCPMVLMSLWPHLTAVYACIPRF